MPGATVLLVDDDDAFMMLVESALKKTQLNASFRYVWDGDQAISYLSRQGIFSNEEAFPTPTLVLLDLKMPRVGGLEVLEWKSNRPELSKTPFVVLSSSDLDRDIKRATELGARDFFMKPMSFSELVGLVAGLEKFWSQ